MIEPKENIKHLFRTLPTQAGRVGKIIRLDRNERTTPFLDKHLRKIWGRITPEKIVAYPELEPFYGKLSKWLKVDRQQVLLVSGSDTGIRAVYETYVGEGDEVVIFPPTYEMYSVYCDMFGGLKREVFYNQDFTLPLERVFNAIGQRTKLVVIANPSHLGTVLAETDLIRIITAAKQNNTLVLVDEAYFHFYRGTVLPYINEFDNLIVVRTFSKAFGLAGLRIGYLVSNKSNIAQLYKVKLTHEITSISAEFGEYLLDNLEIMENYVRDVKQGIEYLSKEFSRLGIVAPATYTNFLLVKPPLDKNSEKIAGLLKEKNFYVRGPFSAVPVKGFIRITAGPLKQMRAFISVFKEIYGKSHKT